MKTINTYLDGCALMGTVKIQWIAEPNFQLRQYHRGNAINILKQKQ